MDTLVGGIVTLGMGVIVVAAIYQLGTNASNVTSAASSGYNLTINSLFK